MQYVHYLIYLLLLGSALLALLFKDVIHSLLALSAFSVTLSLTFALYRAPDVAVAEAAVGAGIITGFFVITISNTVGAERGDK